VAKTDEGASALRGGSVVYTLTVTNAGDVPVSQFDVQEQPMAG
jgi:uncharacterized repeat protein (TIGR01451 family)